VTFIPFFKLGELEGEKQEFVFVVDCSGSMVGNKIHFVREALPLFLKALPTGCQFNILKFGTKFESLFPLPSSQNILGMGIYDEENLGRAMDYVKNLKASMGGTELLGPLRALFSPVPSPASSFSSFSFWFCPIGLATCPSPSSSTSPRFRRVFVLTDGEVTNTDQVFLAHQTHHNWSLFSIGIGSSASRGLVEGISRGGRGICEFLEDTERMEKPIMKMLKVAVQPSITNVDFKWLPPSSSSSSASSSSSSSSSSFSLPSLLSTPSTPIPAAPTTGRTLSEEEELLLLELEMGVGPPTQATGAPTSRLPPQVTSPSPYHSLSPSSITFTLFPSSFCYQRQALLECLHSSVERRSHFTLFWNLLKNSKTKKNHSPFFPKESKSLLLLQVDL
jgi:hypothetical protein